MSFDVLTGKIRMWSAQRDLDKADPRLQLLKLVEEVGELTDALLRDNTYEIRDALGDILVVLTILAQQLELDLVDCLEESYLEIRNRRGKTVDGVFIKEEMKRQPIDFMEMVAMMLLEKDITLSEAAEKMEIKESDFIGVITEKTAINFGFVRKLRDRVFPDMPLWFFEGLYKENADD